MENTTNTQSKSYMDHLKAVAKSGFATGVNVAAIAAPILVVISLVGWISKKD